MFKTAIGLLSSLLVLTAGTVVQSEELHTLSMWKSGGEMKAVNILAKAAESIGFKWTNNYADGNFIGTRAEFLKLLIEDNPPNIVQWIVGNELEDLLESGLTVPINLGRIDPRQAFIPEIADVVTIGTNTINSLPVGIHIQNHVMMNEAAFAKADIPIPQSLDDLLSALPRLQEAGVTPIAMSDQVWQMRMVSLSLLSTMLRSADVNEMLYDRLDKEKWVPVFEKLFQNLDVIRKYSNSDIENLAWQDATHRVLSGEAAIQILGDYIGSESDRDEGYICSVFPGSRFLLWGADSLAFTDSGATSDSTRVTELANALLDPVNMAGYIHAKGGIPVIREFDRNSLSRCSRQNLDDWQRFETHRLMLESESWRTTLDTIGKVTADFVQPDADMTPSDAAQRLFAAFTNIKSVH